MNSTAPSNWRIICLQQINIQRIKASEQTLVAFLRWIRH